MRLKERTAQLKQYCSEHDLTYMNERTSVLGYGHSEASKVTAAYRKALKEEEEKLKQIELDNLKNRAILKSKIENGELPLGINPEKQARHLLNPGETEKPDGRSFLTISEKDAQEIVDVYHATGVVKITNNGTKIRETVNTDRIIGCNSNSVTGTLTPTNKITIHYSKTGTHIVPAYPDEKEE